MTDRFKERYKCAWEGWFYAVQRIDLLIISISGASVYVILETLKFSSQNPLQNLWVIKMSGVFFIAAIIVNFISQFTGKKANHYDMIWCEEQIDVISAQDPAQQSAMSKNDCLADVYSAWTRALNITSMILMFIGLTAILLFFLFTF